MNAQKNTEALKPKMDITKLNKIYEGIKLADPVASDNELLLQKVYNDLKLPEPIACEKREHHVSSYIGKEEYEKIIQKSRDDTSKPEEFNDISPWASSSFSAY